MLFLILKDILVAVVELITDFISFELDAYFYFWYIALFTVSLLATLVQKKEGTIKYSTTECVGINFIVIFIYVALGVLLARYFATFKDQPIAGGDKLVFYKISFLLSSAVIFVDIMLDRLKKRRVFSYTAEFLAGSTVCFLVFQWINRTGFIGVQLTLFYIVLVSIAAGIYAIGMKFILEYEDQKEKKAEVI